MKEKKKKKKPLSIWGHNGLCLSSSQGAEWVGSNSFWLKLAYTATTSNLICREWWESGGVPVASQLWHASYVYPLYIFFVVMDGIQFKGPHHLILDSAHSSQSLTLTGSPITVLHASVATTLIGRQIVVKNGFKLACSLVIERFIAAQLNKCSIFVIFLFAKLYFEN